MIGTDRYAYTSRLAHVAPRAKLLAMAVTTVLCLCLDRISVSVVTIVLMGTATVCMGGVRLRDFRRMMLVPAGFMLLATITIFIGRYAPGTDMLAGISIGNYVYGITAAAVMQGANICLRALGVVASVYFLAMNTPMTDITGALRQMHVPALMVELMELIYRFIFVLYETMHRIHTAQASRLGYDGLVNSYHSTGTLAAMLFVRAYQKSDRVYAALESRGGGQSVRTLADEYESGRTVYLLCAGAAAVQIAVYCIERGLTA